MRVWITEKPDQANHLAPLLGNAQKSRGYYDTDDGRVVWQFGHMLRQAAPEDYSPAWEKWTPDALPMIPGQWKMLPDPDNRAQVAVVADALKLASEVVIATDCDAEGEAIAREIIDHCGYRGAIKRLWYNATDERSMRKAIANLRDGDETKPMYWSAQSRSRADWLIGMNLTRAYTLLSQASGARGVRSVGRVQTPTLALVVRRDRAIENFTARSYYELDAIASTASGHQVTLRHAPAEDARIFDRDAAQALAKQASGARGPISVVKEEKNTAPPKLFSMARLQKAASSKWGWGADKTLKVAQELYDNPIGLLTYPRAGSVFLPEEQTPDIPEILAALSTVGALAHAVATANVEGPVVRNTVFNTKKLDGEPHHAIIPTTVTPDLAKLTEDQRSLYVLVAQSYVSALLKDYRYAETTMSLDANGVPFSVSGKVPLSQGWRAVYGGADPEEETEGDDADKGKIALPNVPHGNAATMGDVALSPKKTKAPKRYTEGDLIADMAAVAKYATDPAVKARLRETSGIGTEATRASIIANLRERGFLQSQGKFIISTPVGRDLIDKVDPEIADPTMTALWEDVLHAMRGGKLPESARDAFVDKVATRVRDLVSKVVGGARAASASRAPSEAQVSFARKIGTDLGVPVPANVATSFDACKAFIDMHQATVTKLPPSDKQIEFAQKIGKAAGVDLPADVRSSRKACSDFIEKHKSALPAPSGAANTKAKKVGRK